MLLNYKFFSKLYLNNRKLLNISKINGYLNLCTSESAVINKKIGIGKPNDREMGGKICWMDMEMTGLDIAKDKIMEFSCLLTDKDLNVLSEGLSIVIRHPAEVLENMNEWCKKHHGESGLTKKCIESEISLEKAENILLEYLKKHIPKGTVPLAGNSIYMDRLFLRSQMPLVDDYLNYRIIDVSSIKELARRWNPVIFTSAPKKILCHRSLEDIKESIDELKYYRENFFKIC